MRVYHKHKESYIVAKGSFAGVFASLAEIMRVHKMHPDFKISVAQQSIDEDLEASSRQSSYEHPDVEADTSIRGFAYNVDADGQASQLAANGEVTFQGDAHNHRVAGRDGLDYYDTGKDFETRGVVDQDGK